MEEGAETRQAGIPPPWGEVPAERVEIQSGVLQTSGGEVPGETGRMEEALHGIWVPAVCGRQELS